MDTVFELSKPHRSNHYLPACDVPQTLPDDRFLRKEAPHLPCIAESDLARHYTVLSRRSFGVCDGFYPLGSCTMKYNPQVNEAIADQEGFRDIHPLQPDYTVQGALEAMYKTSKALCEICAMDQFTLQPAAGAHGELTGLMLIRAYHRAQGSLQRTEVIVPDTAHGTNPASATMAGFSTVEVASDKDGFVDLNALREAVGINTAALMLTNPNTLGLFDPHIEEICAIVHEAGGLCYYDGANLNAIMGIARPGDMGFDCLHVNLHKTFSTPHGGGGPGSGPVGCKASLAQFLPAPIISKQDGIYRFQTPKNSIGRVKSFHGNFLVTLKALAYIMSLGREGIPESARAAVLNANYLMEKIKDEYCVPYSGPCMHEFVLDIAPLKDKTGVSAQDIAKRLIDAGMHPPTMYFPLIVHEALMFEPTETESKETLDKAADILHALYQEACEDASILQSAPTTTPIGRPDEVSAARKPIVRWKP